MKREARFQRDAVGSQVIDALEAQEIKEAGQERPVADRIFQFGVRILKNLSSFCGTTPAQELVGKNDAEIAERGDKARSSSTFQF